MTINATISTLKEIKLNNLQKPNWPRGDNSKKLWKNTAYDKIHVYIVINDWRWRNLRKLEFTSPGSST